jgi:hypothetical protein
MVATGGSSGSAIVDAEDGMVIGITQRVFGADVFGQTVKQVLGNGVLTINPIPVSGMAKVGLAYGASFLVFARLPETAKESYENDIPISTHPLEVSGLRFGYTTPSAPPHRTNT